jgi:hypothetical protein
MAFTKEVPDEILKDYHGQCAAHIALGVLQRNRFPLRAGNVLRTLPWSFATEPLPSESRAQVLCCKTPRIGPGHRLPAANATGVSRLFELRAYSPSRGKTLTGFALEFCNGSVSL